MASIHRTLSTALDRSNKQTLRSLEDFLGSLLDEELSVLANLPGTPGQVMAAQFTYYVRSSVALREELRRDNTKFITLMDAVLRLPRADE